MVVVALPMEEVGNQLDYPNNDVYSKDSTNPYYITAAWDEQKIYSVDEGPPTVFTVGEGGSAVYPAMPPGMPSRVSYINQPLKASTSYSFFIRYDIMSDTGPEVNAGIVFYQTRC